MGIFTMIDFFLVIICAAYVAIPVIGWSANFWIGLTLTLWTVALAGIIFLLEWKLRTR